MADYRIVEVYKRYLLPQESGKSAMWAPEPRLVGEGWFHQWGVNYEEFSSADPMMYSVALVEMPDGWIQEVMPSLLRFKNNPPGREREEGTT